MDAREVEAVRSLVKAHRYEDVIPDRLYQHAQSLIRDPEKSSVLDVFRFHDLIANSPANFSATDAAQAVVIAKRLGHDGVRARLLAIQAEAEYRTGNVSDALVLLNSKIGAKTSGRRRPGSRVVECFDAGQVFDKRPARLPP